MWPGLPELWFRGKWSGLPAAITFAIVLNVLLVARFIYPQWLEPLMVRLVFWAFVAIWVGLFIKAIRGLPQMLAPRMTSKTEDRYDEARTQYLKARWYEAEALLAECLETDPRDAPAMLLLASVYRKTDRFSAAQQTLQCMGSLETGDGWWLEREAEERRLRLSQEELNDKAEDADSNDSDEQEATGTDDAAAQNAVDLESAKASNPTKDSVTEKIAADLAGSLQFAGSGVKRD